MCWCNEGSERRALCWQTVIPTSSMPLYYNIATPNKMSFNDLPNELLDQIILTLEKSSEKPKADLSNLSQTSHQFHSLVIPILYGTLEETKPESILEMLSAILQHPHLGALVRSYRGWHRRPWTFTKASVDQYFSVRDTRAVVEASIYSTSANQPLARDWTNKIMDGSWDAATALLLIHLPNLQHLRLAIQGARPHTPIFLDSETIPPNATVYSRLSDIFIRAEYLQRQQITSPFALQNLTAITLVPSTARNRRLDLAQLLQFLGLESLKEVIIQGFDLYAIGNHQPIAALTDRERGLVHFHERDTTVERRGSNQLAGG